MRRTITVIFLVLVLASTVYSQVKMERSDYRALFDYDIRPAPTTLYREDSYDSTTYRIIDGTGIDSSGIFTATIYNSLLLNVSGGDSLDLKVTVYAGNTRRSSGDPTVSDSNYMYFQAVDSTTISTSGVTLWNTTSSVPTAEHMFFTFEANTADHDSATISPAILNRDQH